VRNKKRAVKLLSVSAIACGFWWFVDDIWIFVTQQKFLVGITSPRLLNALTQFYSSQR
jgi:hypothetical protein